MRKGPLCDGCPARDFSPSYTPDEIHPGAVIYLVAQGPGAQEEALSRPMVGKTGQKWESTYLRDAGLTRGDINIGNVIRCRWKGEDDLPPVSSVLIKQAITHCQAAYFNPPPETRLLIAMGDYACLALTGSTVSDGDKAGNGWRGYLKPQAPFTYEPSGETRAAPPRDGMLRRGTSVKSQKARKSSQGGSSARTEAPVGGAAALPREPSTRLAREADPPSTLSNPGGLHGEGSPSGSAQMAQGTSLSPRARKRASERTDRPAGLEAEGNSGLSAQGGQAPEGPIAQRTEQEASTLQAAGSTPAGSSTYWLPGPGEPLPVLVTWHIARTFHQPWWILPTRKDWGKVPRILSGRWPIGPPAFRDQPPQPWPDMFTFDTEFLYKWAFGTWPRGSRPPLMRYSMSWGLGDNETAVVEMDQHPGWPRIEIRRPRVVTQYSPADVWHLASLMPGANVWEECLIEDAIWKHSTLWSDHQHDLNYLGSLYGSWNRWKHLSGSQPRLYAGLDALGLLEVDRALEAELDGDPASRRVWEDIDRPALGEFVRAQYRGIATDSDRITLAVAQLQGEVDAASAQARAVTGWPIKLSSNPQVAKRLYVAEDIRPQR